MSQTTTPRRRTPIARTPIALLVVVFALSQASAIAQDKTGPTTCTNAPGVLMARTKTGWKAIRQGESLPADSTIVSLFDSTFRSANDGVEVRMVADIAQRGPLPILESALMLQVNPKHDLALVPLRGLIVLTNVKKSGPATVWLGMREESIEVTLKEPGAKLAMEIYGRHVPGTPHLDNPKEDDPVMNLFFIALVGEAFLRCGEKGVGVHAPPGPAILTWDSLLREPEVKRLEELPPEVTAMREKDVKLMALVCDWSRHFADKPVAAVLTEGAGSKSELVRQAAVTSMGALDELPALLDVLAGAPNADARTHAVLTLRHWLGRAPGQTAKLDAALRNLGYTPVQSRTVLHLLYGFTAEERRDPDTYGLLLDGLKHNKGAVRELSYWHLSRLAPAGKDIAYDAVAPEADRLRAYEQWRTLIPTGKLPPAPKKAS